MMRGIVLFLVVMMVVMRAVLMMGGIVMMRGVVMVGIVMMTGILGRGLGRFCNRRGGGKRESGQRCKCVFEHV